METCWQLLKKAGPVALAAEATPTVLDGLLGLVLVYVEQEKLGCAAELLARIQEHPAASKETQDRA